MYIDKNLLMSDAQVICNSGSELSDYSINLMAARKAWGGQQLYVVIIVDTSFATATSINFQVVTDSVAALNDTPTVQIETGAIVVASLTAKRAPIVIPIGSALGTQEQYLGMNYVLAGSNASAGAVTAFVAFDAPSEA